MVMGRAAHSPQARQCKVDTAHCASARRSDGAAEKHCVIHHLRLTTPTLDAPRLGSLALQQGRVM